MADSLLFDVVLVDANNDPIMVHLRGVPMGEAIKSSTAWNDDPNNHPVAVVAMAGSIQCRLGSNAASVDEQDDLPTRILEHSRTVWGNPQEPRRWLILYPDSKLNFQIAAGSFTRDEAQRFIETWDGYELVYRVRLRDDNKLNKKRLRNKFANLIPSH